MFQTNTPRTEDVPANGATRHCDERFAKTYLILGVRGDSKQIDEENRLGPAEKNSTSYLKIKEILEIA
jgi:hypothetical protein